MASFAFVGTDYSQVPVMRQAKLILEQHSCNLILYDLRDTKIVDGILATYDTGDQATRLGFDYRFKAAILYSQDKEKHAFVETVMVNRGYRVRAFTDESEAIGWLTGRGDS